MLIFQTSDETANVLKQMHNDNNKGFFYFVIRKKHSATESIRRFKANRAAKLRNIAKYEIRNRKLVHRLPITLSRIVRDLSHI